MTVSWKSWPNLLCICVSMCGTGVVSQLLQLKPENSTVLQGSDVRFNCTVQGDWEVMIWTVQKLFILTFLATGSTPPSLERYSARFCSSGDTSCVEFTIHNVTRNDSGPVTCSVQGDYGSRTAQLNVQESGTVNIMGGNVTVMQDEQVEFQCLTSAWFPSPTVSWTRNGLAVNSSLYNTSSMADGDSFNSTSVLSFQAVSNTTVECWATVPTLTTPQSSSVFLVVVPKPPDWTVLIAVVVSFGGFALLVLLIIGIIFCYTRRKEKQHNYQDEMSRRVRTQSQLSSDTKAAHRQGQVNTGYVPEGQTSVTPSELTDSGFSQMPDDVSRDQAENGYKTAYNTVDGSGIRKHRHVTIV